VVDAAVDDALRAAGFAVQRITIPELQDVIAASAALLDAQAWATNAELYGRAADRIGANVRDRLGQASTITDARLSAARTMNTRWKAALDVVWGRVELLALPTLLGFPPLIDEAQSIFGIRGVTTPVNAAGLPALALPVPAAGGPRAGNGPLPASVQLIGPVNGEDRLLAAGALLEAAVRA
jgi:amidase